MANNPYVNKVVKEGTTLIDISSDTVSPSSLAQGYTAHDASGAQITGTMTGGSMVIRDEEDEHGGTIRHITAGTVIQGTVDITENGIVDVAEYADANINVPTGTARSSSDLTVSGATVTVPAGLYSTQASKSVSTMTLPTAASSTSSGTSKATISRSTSDQYINIPTGYNSSAAYYKVSAVANGSATTPATTVTANPSISVDSSTGLITATASATKSVTPTVSAGYVSSGTAGTITVSGSNTSQLFTQTAKTVTPTESSQTAVAAGKYTTGAVTVDAISSTYVGSGITQRSSTDMTVSGATVTAPAGYYESPGSQSVSLMTLPTSASSGTSGTLKATISRSTSNQYINIPRGYNSSAAYYQVSAVANGTEGTPTATKGTVSNNAISVTPSVTNTAGYISGGTKTGTAVSVSASELVSGNKEITENGTGIDVTNYATVSVDVATSVDTYTCTISGTGNSSNCYVQVNQTGTKYYTNGNTFTYNYGDNLYFYFRGQSTPGVSLSVNSVVLYSNTGTSARSYTITSPHCDMTIDMEYASLTTIDITVAQSQMASLTANGLHSVGQYSFANVSVPGMSESELREYLRRNISSFSTIDWPSNTTTIGTYAFAGCNYFNPSSLPSTLTTIGNYAFYQCNQLTLTSLPSTVTSIGQYAFYSCSKLALTSLPSGITKIDTCAFYYCTLLALTSLPSGVTTIGSNAFCSCTSLALTSLPSTVTTIGTYAFQNCTSLALTSLPSGITKIDTSVFDGCTGLTTMTIPAGVSSIGQSAFYRCTGLTSVSLPSSITTINSNAFGNCSSLTSISCDGVITTMAVNAFTGSSTNTMSLVSASFPNMNLSSSLSYSFGSGTAANACKSLKTVDIGITSSIGANAFANCFALDTLILRKTASVCTLSNISAFVNTPLRGYDSKTGTVYVPSALISTYKTATNWGTMYSAGTVTFSAIEGSQYDLS